MMLSNVKSKNESIIFSVFSIGWVETSLNVYMALLFFKYGFKSSSNCIFKIFPIFLKVISSCSLFKSFMLNLNLISESFI